MEVIKPIKWDNEWRKKKIEKKLESVLEIQKTKQKKGKFFTPLRSLFEKSNKQLW